jgi:predicted 3-demethylubiquinone-9 3-methyltransferase (glyoxalase superfamily)
MQKITPFLWFDNKAEEAMNFYVSLFSGSPAKKAESKIVNIKRYPKGPVGPMKDMEGKVLTGIFELEGQRYMALDGGPLFKFTEAISLLVEVDTQQELDYYWDNLSAVPTAEQCGWLKDKYGLSWQIVPKGLEKWMSDKDAERSNRAMQAVLKMKKIIIADIEKAYDGK